MNNLSINDSEDGQDGQQISSKSKVEEKMDMPQIEHAASQDSKQWALNRHKQQREEAKASQKEAKPTHDDVFPLDQMSKL